MENALSTFEKLGHAKEFAAIGDQEISLCRA